MLFRPLHRYTLHVPLNMNDGTPRPDVHEDVRADILAMGVDAWHEQDANGSWRGDTFEPERLYVIDSAHRTAGGIDIAYALDIIAQNVKATMEQDAVYVTRQGIHTKLV